MAARPRSLPNTILTSLAGACLFAGCASAPPEPPKPPPPKEEIAVAPPPPPATAEPAPPPPPPEIGSKFEVDPDEPLPPGAVARCGTGKMRASSPKATIVTNAGSIYAVDNDWEGWVLRDVTRGRDLFALPRGEGAAFTPDGSLLVQSRGFGSGVILFYAVPSGKPLGEVAVPLPKPPAKAAKRGILAAFADSTRVEDLLMAPDGKAVAVTTSDGSVHLIDIPSLKLVKTTKLPAKSHVRGVSAGGARAVVEHLKNEVGPISSLFGGLNPLTGYSVVDLHSGATLRKAAFKAPPRDPSDPPDYTPPTPHEDASFLLSADGATVLRFEQSDLTGIDVATGKESEIKGGSGRAGGAFGTGSIGGLGSGRGGFGGLGGLGLSRWGRAESLRILGGGRAFVDGEIVNLADGSVIASPGGMFEAISADGQHIVTRSDRVFEISTGGPDLRPGAVNPVTGLAFLPDNRLASTSGSAVVWKTDDCAVDETLKGASSTVTAARDKAFVFFGTGTPMLLDPKGQRRALNKDPGLRLSALAPDGSLLLLGVGDEYKGENRLEAVDLADDGGRRQTRAFQRPLQGLAASPDGQWIGVSVGERWGEKADTLMLLSPADLATKVEVDVDRAGALAFAGADALIHAPSGQGLSVRSTSTLAEQRRMHFGACCDETAVSPDGKLAAGAKDRDVVIWDIASRRRVAVVRKAHREDIKSLAFSPDSRYLATGSADTTILIWDVRKLSVPPLPSKVETLVSDPKAASLAFASTSLLLRIKGDGTLEYRSPKTTNKPPPLRSVTRLSGTWSAHCAIAESKVRCWGSTQGGVLGVPERKGTAKWSFAEITTPTTVAVADPVDVLVESGMGCGLSRSGDLTCWGRLAYQDPIRAPAKILDGVKSIAMAQRRLCAAGSDGLVRCFDSLGKPPTTLAAKDAVALTGGHESMCLLDKAGAVHCQGDNRWDELGDDTGLPSATPVNVTGLPPVAAIASWMYGVCALTTTGQVHCWGAMGDASLDRATHLPALDGATALQASNSGVCALRQGQIDCLALRESR